MSFQVPDVTSTNNTEFVPDKYVIPFAPELVSLILDDKKSTTYRFGKKYDYLQTGDRVKIQNSNSKKIVADAEITAKAETTFKELPLDDGSHEAYEDKEHQRQVLSGYYAYVGRPISDDDIFLVLDFKLIGKQA